MKRIITLLLALTMLLALAACGGGTTATTPPASTPAPSSSAPATSAPASTEPAPPADSFKIGVILIGDENEGYTYAHIEGIEEAKKNLNLTDDQIIFKYNIPEDETCYDTAVDLIEQGCDIVFSNSFSHESYMIQAAEEYPDNHFFPATGQQAEACGLDNVTNYFPQTYQSRYISGVVAGMKLKELMDDGSVTDPHVGYVGAYPYAEVVSGYTAFFLGIRSIVPEAYMDVTYTNSRFDTVAENEAAKSLMSRGCVIIGQHADSTGAPAAVQDALKSGSVAYSVGYNIDMLSVAPDAALTSAQNCWGVLYTMMIDDAINGREIKQNYTAGYESDGVQISPLGPSCAEGTEAAVNDAIGLIKNDTLHIFDCETWTTGGEKLDSYDQSWGFEGVQLIWDGYFHESEVISAPLFDIRIDGITELQS